MYDLKCLKTNILREITEHYICKGFLTTLVEHKATYLNLVPPIILFLANNEKVTKRHLEHVRTIMSGAAPLGSSDIERVQKK